MNLKGQLRFYLDHRSMTAAQLARKASVPKQSISGWLAGNNPRDVRQVKRVADILEVSLDHLMFGAEVNSEHPSEARAPADMLGAMLGDEWISGVFEVRLRRVKR